MKANTNHPHKRLTRGYERLLRKEQLSILQKPARITFIKTLRLPPYMTSQINIYTITDLRNLDAILRQDQKALHTLSLEQEREALWLRIEELTWIKFINHKKSLLSFSWV